MRQELNASLRPALLTAAVALSVAVIVAALLAQLLLRPIHVIRSGLTRLGQGEFGVTLDLPQGDEFGELGQFFNTVSQQISADRTQLVGQTAHLQSAVEHLEDAVALFTQSGDLLFSNRAMQAAMPGAIVGRPIRELLPAGHPFRTIVEETLSARKPRGPVQAQLEVRGSNASADAGGVRDETAQALQLSTHPIGGRDGFMGVILVARNLAAHSRVQSSLAYSRKLVALGRLTAGIAHEVKNPLNAMMIHLELLRTKIRSAAEVGEPQPAAVGSSLGLSAVQRTSPAVESALRHVEVIESEVRRLDEVVQGFLKFTRPEELKLQPVSLPALFEEILPLIEPEARANKVKVVVDAPGSLPDVNGDAGTLRQAFLNLAINACQAMGDGGTLRLAATAGPQRTVEVRVEDTGSGIPPDQLGKIFDLYYTTKEHGTGIGLSMVYRTIQMHDGELEVQSTPGSGTTFRVVLPQAP
jgi:signal transduction histidine kinase